MRAPRYYATAAFLAAFGALQSAEPQLPKTAAPKSASAPKKKEYELPKTGVNIARKEGGWINVEGSGTRFVIKFFDKEKKPISPDVERGLARFNYAAKNDIRAPLHREGDTLTTPATIRPPHNFQVILSLFTGEVGEPREVYTFKYP